MAKWARIVDGVVHETLGFDPTGRFPEDFVWVTCGDDVNCHWVYNAKKKTFSEPALPVASELQPELPADRIGEDLPEGATIAPPLNEIPTA